MQLFEHFPTARSRAVCLVLTDGGDTLTEGARLRAAAFDALERLRDGGFWIIPITAAPAGWCDLKCRMWPVAAVIGENGGRILNPRLMQRESGSIGRAAGWSRPPRR